MKLVLFNIPWSAAPPKNGYMSLGPGFIASRVHWVQGSLCPGFIASQVVCLQLVCNFFSPTFSTLLQLSLQLFWAIFMLLFLQLFFATVSTCCNFVATFFLATFFATFPTLLQLSLQPFFYITFLQFVLQLFLPKTFIKSCKTSCNKVAFFLQKVAHFFFKKLRKQLQQTCKKLQKKLQQSCKQLQKKVALFLQKVAPIYFFKKLQKQLQQTFKKLQKKVAKTIATN